MTEFRPGGLELTAAAAELAGLDPGDELLDIGCGLGSSLDFLSARFGIKPRGVDISEPTVQRAGRDYIGPGDACGLPFADGCFDAVLLECVLSLTAEPERALSEACRVLKKGGRLLLSTLSVHGAAELVERGRVDIPTLERRLAGLGMSLLCSRDESACLRSFVAQAVFRFGSLEAYSDYARRELGGAVLDCAVPRVGTGYRLVIAQKTEDISDGGDI